MDDPAPYWLRLAEPYLLTLNEAAAMLGLSRRAVERLIQRQQLPEIRFKGRRYIKSYDIEGYWWKQKKIMLTSERNLYSENFDANGKSQVIKINAHLMSEMQTPGTAASSSTYSNFHSRHIGYLAEALDIVLPGNYYAVAETSLQVRNDDLSLSFPRPDVTIYQHSRGATEPAQSPVLMLPLELKDTSDWMSVVIYEFEPGEGKPETDNHHTYGKPVTRIELLSPSNMPGGGHYGLYEVNRNRALGAGIPLVEIDYLHEYRSPVAGVPLYPQDSAAKAYNICVSDPRVGKVYAYLFGLDMAIPRVIIPLAGEETLDFDFGVPYQMTWEKTRALWNIVDYSQEPPRMNTYSEADQGYIRHKLQEIRQVLRKV